MVSSVLSIVLTARMTTPLRRIAEAAKRFGNSDFSARVPVDGEKGRALLDNIYNLALDFERKRQSFRAADVLADEIQTALVHSDKANGIEMIRPEFAGAELHVA